MNLTLRVWRQKNSQSAGSFETYEARGVEPDMSFLEMLDRVNDDLQVDHKEPIAFDHDCREGICGSCSLVIDGSAHGPNRATTTCQLFMRHFKDGQEITIEPFRADAFPILRDLVVDRSAFDRVIQSGGYITSNTGAAPDGNAIPIPKEDADAAFQAAACIGCGACVAACPNAAAMLFVSAKVGQLAHLPQGQAERSKRAVNMVRQMDKEGFGTCTNHYECSAACPKEIPVSFIAKLNADYLKSAATKEALGQPAPEIPVEKRD